MGHGVAHRLSHGVFGHGNAAGEVPAVDFEGNNARLGHQKRVADRDVAGLVRNPGTIGQRTAGVIEMLGFHRPDRRARRSVLDRNRNAARQAAAAARDNDSVELDPERACLRHKFKADRALAGDDGRIVIGRDEHHAALDIGANHRRAVLAVAIERHHLGTHPADVADLDRRRVGRHGDDRLDAEHRGRRGDPLRMVAGRESDDTAATLFVAQRRQLVVGAAEFERAGALQRLRLEQDAPAVALVELRRFDQRRFDGQAAEPCGGGVDIGNAG